MIDRDLMFGISWFITKGAEGAACESITHGQLPVAMS